MSSPKRTLVVVAVLMLATSLLIRVALASSPSMRRWTVPVHVEPTLSDFVERPARVAERPRPYLGHERWCEAVEPAPCRRASDCGPAPDGKPQGCVEPWWARKSNRKLPPAKRERVCASAWPGPSQQRWRRARLGAVVDHVCRRPGCDPAELGRFLGIVAERESTWRPWKTHRLNEDLSANRKAYKRKAKLYAGNTHYRSAHRWQGYGLFGQNSPLFVYLWDPAAPPEILCREIEAVDTYLERARIATRKQADLGITPTWATVHGAVATGEIRPSERALERFRPDARHAGIDPDERVRARDFGEPLGADVPSRRLAAEVLRGRIDARFGSGS